MSEPILETPDENDNDNLERTEPGDDGERHQLQEKALDAAFELAMRVRSYLGALDRDDEMLRRWVLRQIEAEFPKLASAVITPITKIENIDHFEVYGEPRL